MKHSTIARSFGIGTACAAITAVYLVQVAPRATAGALDLGPGAVAIEYVPYRIALPGVYYLARDLYSDTGGIVITADDVTVDLRGFTLSGSGAGATSGISGLDVNNVEIRNGTVRGFGGSGIQLARSSTIVQLESHRVFDVHAVDNAGYGIFLEGKPGIVERCIAAANGLDGIHLVSGLVGHCDASGNQETGIWMQARGKIEGNTVQSNLLGIFADWSVTISGNFVFQNNSDDDDEGGGIRAESNSTITGNDVRENGSVGIQGGGMGAYAFDDVHILDNVIQGSDVGIRLRAFDSIVEHNVVTSCGTGIHIPYAGNLYVNNRCGANSTDFDLYFAIDGGGNLTF